VKPPFLQSITNKMKGQAIMKSMAKYRLCGQLNTTISGKLLYLILLDACGAESAAIIPQRRISETIGLSRDTIRRNLKKLRDSGYINIIEQYHNDGGRAANKYVLK
jgi:biotin operon repressor